MHDMGFRVDTTEPSDTDPRENPTPTPAPAGVLPPIPLSEPGPDGLPAGLGMMAPAGG